MASMIAPWLGDHFVLHRQIWELGRGLQSLEVLVLDVFYLLRFCGDPG